MEQNVEWVEQLDILARAVFNALQKGDISQAEVHFATVMRRAETWFKPRLLRHGVTADEANELVPAISIRLWNALSREAQKGAPPHSLLAMLTPIIHSVASDHLRQTNSTQRRILSNLRLLLIKPGSSFAVWTNSQMECTGLQHWKGRPLNASTPFETEHAERIRLAMQDQRTGHAEWNIGQMIQCLLEHTYRIYPHPLPVKTVQDLAVDCLTPYLPRIESLDTPDPTTGAPMGEKIPAPAKSVETTVIRKVSFEDLKTGMRNLLQALPPRQQLALLLCRNEDELQCLCAPQPIAAVLAPLLEVALTLPPADAETLARRYAREVPIPDEVVAEQIGIKTGHLYVLRSRACKSYRDSNLNGLQQEWQQL